MNIDLRNYCQQCIMNAKNLEDVIQENKNAWGFDDDKIMDTMPMLQKKKMDFFWQILKCQRTSVFDRVQTCES